MGRWVEPLLDDVVWEALLAVARVNFLADGLLGAGELVGAEPRAGHHQQRDLLVFRSCCGDCGCCGCRECAKRHSGECERHDLKRRSDKRLNYDVTHRTILYPP